MIRLLYKKGYSKQDIINLFRFIDWIMYLPEREEKLLWQELEKYEKEEKMQYVTSVERIGFERGMKTGEIKGKIKGEKRGMQKGMLAVAKMIARKFGSDPELELTYMAGLKAGDLPLLVDHIFDFEALEQVHEWIDSRISSKENQDGQEV